MERNRPWRTALWLAGSRHRFRDDVVAFMVVLMATACGFWGSYQPLDRPGWHNIVAYLGIFLVTCAPLWFLHNTLKDANLLSSLRRSGMLELVQISPLSQKLLVDGVFLYRFAWALTWGVLSVFWTLVSGNEFYLALGIMALLFSTLSYPAQCFVLWYDSGAPPQVLLRGVLMVCLGLTLSLAGGPSLAVGVGVGLLALTRHWARTHLGRRRPSAASSGNGGIWLSAGNPVLALEFCRWSRRQRPLRRFFSVFGMGLFMLPWLWVNSDQPVVFFLFLIGYVVVSWFRTAFTNHRMMQEASQSGSLTLVLTTGVSAAEIIDGYALASALPRLLESLILLPLCVGAAITGGWGFQWGLTAVAALILCPLSGGYVAREVVRLTTGSAFWDVLRTLFLTILALVGIFLGASLAIIAGANGLFGWFTVAVAAIFVLSNRHQRIQALVGSRCPVLGMRLQVARSI